MTTVRDILTLFAEEYNILVDTNARWVPYEMGRLFDVDVTGAALVGKLKEEIGELKEEIEDLEEEVEDLQRQLRRTEDALDSEDAAAYEDYYGERL